MRKMAVSSQESLPPKNEGKTKRGDVKSTKGEKSACLIRSVKKKKLMRFVDKRG